MLPAISAQSKSTPAIADAQEKKMCFMDDTAPSA